MMRPRLLFIASLVLTLSAHAEQVYVSDKLVANLLDTAGQDGKKVTTVESGDALEVLEREEGFVRVRTDSGNEGWIKSSYLMTQPTAARRLKELEARGPVEQGGVDTSKYTQEISQLQEKNKALDTEVSGLRKAMDEANAKIAAASAATQETSVAMSSTPSAQTVGERSAEMPSIQIGWSSRAIVIVGVLYGVAGVLGFVAGYRTLARRIRRKYGRVKIY
jgi:SH3 domain protein